MPIIELYIVFSCAQVNRMKQHNIGKGIKHYDCALTCLYLAKNRSHKVDVS